MRPMTRHPILLAAIVTAGLTAARLDAQSSAPPASADQSIAELSRLVAGLNTTARVLMIGMHPDDEDTELLTWLSRAKHVETAYLSITRGEAGMNFGGSESGNSLGAIRTQEVLAARRVDGASQYFTRAFDFGSARNVNDVLKRWNPDSIVGDIVAVIRSFRPQVIVAMLPDSVISGDGQHQALELFVAQAFLSSTNTRRYPVDPFGIPWLVSRIYRPGHGFVIETSGYDRATGKTFAELAMESRAQQRSQGLRDITQPKPPQIELRRLALKTGDSTANDRSLFDGIDTTFIRLGRSVPGEVGLSVLAMAANADSAQRALDVLEPAAAIPFLSQIVQHASTIRSALPWCRHPSPTAAPPVLPHGNCEPRFLDIDAAVDLVNSRAQAALLIAAGVSPEVNADRDLVAGDDTVPVTVTVANRGRAAVSLADLAVWGNVDARIQPVTIEPDSVVRVTAHVRGLPDPHPWWVGSRGGEERGGDRYKAVVSSVDGLLETDLIPAARTLLGVAIPENYRRTSDATVTLSVAGATITTSVGPIIHRHADADVGLQNRTVAGIPDVTLGFSRGLEWIPRNKPVNRSLRVAIKSHSDRDQDFTLNVLAPQGMPQGLRVDSLPPSVHLTPNESRELLVQLRGNLRERKRLPLGIVGEPRTPGVDGEKQFQKFQNGLQTIQRGYLPPIRMMPASGEWIQPIDITVPANLTTLYVAGSPDDIAPALRQVGGWVMQIETADQLLSVDLSRVASIAIGARAFDLHPELLGQVGRLVDFVRGGGTLVVLRGDEPTIASKFFPYPLSLARPAERAMQPDAPIAVLEPSARLLNWPNKIGKDDWAEWVGERAQLIPTTVDPRYTKLIEVHDEGEPANRNALLVAKLGKGTLIYTSLTFEQQITGGVPGGLRLFVNLLSAGLTPK